MICVRCDLCGATRAVELVGGCGCQGSFAKIPAPSGWVRVDDRHYCGEACRDAAEAGEARDVMVINGVRVR